MTDTGMTRKIDDLGRIVVPVEIRRSLVLAAGDRLSIAVEDGAVVLRPLREACVFCGASVELTTHRDQLVCASCRSELAPGLPTTRR